MHLRFLVASLCVTASFATLSLDEQVAARKLCENLGSGQSSWCPDGYASPGFDHCVQLGPFLKCEDESVTDLVLENFPGISRLTGSIPTEIGHLTNLKRFYARSNAISGFIPTELGNTAIYDLNLNDNHLIGPLPSEIGLLNLIALEVEANQLDGQIPSELFKVTLQNMNVRHNQFSGSIPSEFGLATNLHFFQADNNELSGALPSTIGGPWDIFQIMLNDNQLTNAIPSQIGNLTSLSVLSLLNNQLTGQIPSEIGNMRPGTGSYFLLGDNDLTGTLPTEIGRLTGLSQLAIYDCPNLGGKIPTQIGLMTNAHSLWLYGTSLYGSIPTEIDSLSSNLVSLRLQKNLLSGELPDLSTAFGDQRTVSRQEFWFDDNYITGSLPHYFGSQVLLDCDRTFMTPHDICRFPRQCNNTVQERPTNFDAGQVCRVPSTNLLQGDVFFTPAENEGCFSEYVFYPGTDSAPVTTTPAVTVPKTPTLGNGLLFKSLNGVDITGATHLLIYGLPGAPSSPNDITTTPVRINLATIADCSSGTSSLTPSTSITPSRTPSPQFTVSHRNDESGGGGGSNVAGVAVGVSLTAAAVLLVGCIVMHRRRKGVNRAIVSPSSHEYDDSL